jgi:mannose-6-phosphate isomerase-like protein (cupin superfamily)
MKIKVVVTALLAAGFALPAGEPQGFKFLPSSELKGFAKSLAPKIDEKKVATQQLGNFGSYSFMVAHREGPGEAEYHETQADIFVVQSGEATLIVGGDMVDGKATAPHEMRGPSIKGGMEKKIAAGDIVTIPAKTPHQVKLDSGKQFTYFVVKVNQ